MSFVSKRIVLTVFMFFSLLTQLRSNESDQQERAWRNLKKNVFPNLGVKTPVVSESFGTNCIHILLFRKSGNLYGCELFQISNEVSSVSYVLPWDEDQRRFNMKNPIFHTTRHMADGRVLFELAQKIGGIEPVGKPMALGRPVFLCVAVALHGSIKCFYYDCPAEEQEDRQITALVAFAHTIFSDAAGFDSKTLKCIRRMLFGATREDEIMAPQHKADS